MLTFFVLVHLVALVCFIVFLVKMIKQKKVGANNRIAKRNMLISIAVWFVSFILVGVTAPSTDKNAQEDVSNEATSASEATVEEQKTITEKSSSEAESTEDISTKEVSTKETSTEETNTEASTEETVSKEDYITQVKDAIDGAIGKNEVIEDVTLSDGTLIVKVDISKANENANIELPLDDIAVSRASSITDNILELNDSLWEEIVIDFDSVGTVTKTKADVIESEYGKYFEIEALDGVESKSSSGTDTVANQEFISKHSNEIVVAASMALDNFISDYDISLAPQKWTIAKFDETDTVIAMTEITYNKRKGNYIYVGTLNINSSGKVESAKPHYIYVIDTVLGDDGYCDEVFDKIYSVGGN